MNWLQILLKMLKSLAIGVLFFSTVAMAAPPPEFIDGVKGVSLNTMLSFGDYGEYHVIDVSPSSQLSHGYLDGADWIETPTETAILKVTHHKSEPLVFSCNMDGCSAQLTGARAAKKAGFQHVFILTEHWLAWEEAGLPIVQCDVPAHRH